MTTALLWWVAVLGITWGLVVVVRSWRWSPAQDDPSELRTRDLAARLALLPVVVLLVLMALVSLLLLGWSSSPTGWRRALESLPLLTVCAATGGGAVAGVRTIAGRRVGSWWLVGLLPALAGAAVQFGA